MTILNKDYLYYLNIANNGEHYKQIRGDMFVWPQYEESKDKFFGLEFNTGTVFNVYPLDSLLSASDIELIRNGSATLILSNTHEAYHYYIEDLYTTIVSAYNIPPENILILSESADIASHITTVANKLGQREMKSRWMRRFEQDVKRDYTNLTTPAPKTLEDKTYDKKFLCFNRRWRGNRTVLVELLHALDLLKYGHVSLAKSDDNRSWEHMCYRDLAFMKDCEEAVILLDSVREEMINSFPELYLDNKDLITNRAQLVADTNYLYEETYFSVVTETFFFKTERPEEYGRFLSEKTFKPVAMQHPFLVLSTPHFLVKFKELGYKSFSPWIDESYDLEPNDALRMMKVVREIQRLCNLSDSERTEFLTEIRKICKHNFELLMSKDKDSDWFSDL